MVYIIPKWARRFQDFSATLMVGFIMEVLHGQVQSIVNKARRRRNECERRRQWLEPIY